MNKRREKWFCDHTKYLLGNEALGKCFHNTEEVMTLHNHYPINCLTYESRYCNSFVVKPPLAHLQHWRRHCKNTYCNSKIGATEKCTLDCLNSTVYDSSIFKYKEKLLSRMKKMIEEIKRF